MDNNTIYGFEDSYIESLMKTDYYSKICEWLDEENLILKDLSYILK